METFSVVATRGGGGVCSTGTRWVEATDATEDGPHDTEYPVQDASNELRHSALNK